MIRLGFALSLFASALGAGDFTMFKGDPARTGRAAEKLGAPVRLAWTVDSGGAFYSSPAIVSGTAYLGNSDHHVYAFDIHNGAQKWKAKLPERIYGSSPQIEQGLLYIACVDGCVYALDLQGGAVRGRYCVKRSAPFAHGPDILGSPLVFGGRLYFGSDNHMVYALNLPAGGERWRFEAGDKVHDAAAALFENLLLIGSMDGRLYALDKDTGALAWKSGEYDRLNSTPLVHGGRAYVGAADGMLRCFDARKGTLFWSFATRKGIMSSPALNAEGTGLIFGSSDGHVYALGLEGKLKWKFRTRGPVLASPLVAGNSVWIGSYDDIFYALSAASGAEIFRHACGGNIFSSAAASGGKVLVGGRDGVLYCFDATLQ